jgi:hypothetical protein
VIPATFDEITVIVDQMSERLRLLIVLAAFVGLRQGELLELRRSDVDGVTGRINVARKVDKDANPAVRGACPDCGRHISTPKAEQGVAMAGASPAPPALGPWSAARDAVRAALDPLRLPGDAVVLVGEGALQRDWAEAGRLAGFLPGDLFFGPDLTVS